MLSDVEQGLSQFHGSFMAGVGVGIGSTRPVQPRSRRHSLASVLEDVVWDGERDEEGTHTHHGPVTNDSKNHRSNSNNSIDNTSIESGLQKENSNQFSLWDDQVHHDYGGTPHTLCDNPESVPFTSRGASESDFIDFPRLSLEFERYHNVSYHCTHQNKAYHNTANHNTPCHQTPYHNHTFSQHALLNRCTTCHNTSYV